MVTLTISEGFAFFEAFCKPNFKADIGLEELMFQYTSKPIIQKVHAEYAKEFWLWQDVETAEEINLKKD